MSTELRIRLVVARGETKGVAFLIQPGSNLIGRWDPDKGAFPEVDLENHDPEAKVSRRHAVIEFDGTSLTVEDAGSLNGTFINRGSRLAPNEKHELKHGDELVVGKTFLDVEFESPPSS